MDKDKYCKQMANFYAYNFYLEKIPLDMYVDETLGVKCAVMRSSDNPDEVAIVSLDRPFFREEEPPVQVILFASKKLLEDKENARVLKEFHHELMEYVYEDYFNGSIEYPGMFTPNDEFVKRFNKVAYSLQICNGGDPVFIEMDSEEEDCVAYVVSPMFLNEEQFDQYNKLLLVDEDEASNYIFDLDEEENISLLK